MSNCDSNFYIDNPTPQIIEITVPSTGPSGPTGANGVSVVNAEIDAQNDLILHLSDGQYIDAGNVAVNIDGKVISYMYVDSGCNLIVCYADGTTQQIGNVCGPTGPCCTGPTGIGIEYSYVDDCGYLTFVYTNKTISHVGYVVGL
jgi:hypothetical protein